MITINNHEGFGYTKIVDFNIENSVFSAGSFRNSEFSKVDFRNVEFRSVNFGGAIFNNASFSGAKVVMSKGHFEEIANIRMSTAYKKAVEKMANKSHDIGAGMACLSKQCYGDDVVTVDFFEAALYNILRVDANRELETRRRQKNDFFFD